MLRSFLIPFDLPLPPGAELRNGDGVGYGSGVCLLSFAWRRLARKAIHRSNKSTSARDPADRTRFCRLLDTPAARSTRPVQPSLSDVIARRAKVCGARAARAVTRGPFTRRRFAHDPPRPPDPASAEVGSRTCGFGQRSAHAPRARRL